MSTDKLRSDIGTRLRIIREGSGDTQKDFARSLGITQGFLSEIENGKKPPSDTLIKFIVYLFAINQEWLTEGKGKMNRVVGPDSKKIREIWKQSKKKMGKSASTARVGTQPPKQPGEINAASLQPAALGEDRELPEGFALIPCYDLETAGPEAVIPSDQLVAPLAFRTSWIRDLGLKPDALALITTRGDSMEPSLHPGDLLLIDLSNTAVCEDAIYAIHNDSSLIVKRVQKMFDGSLVIKSDNPAYREQVIDKELLKTVRIVGRVIWAGRRL